MNSQGAFHGNGEDDQRQSANTKRPLPPCSSSQEEQT